MSLDAVRLVLSPPPVNSLIYSSIICCSVNEGFSPVSYWLGKAWFSVSVPVSESPLTQIQLQDQGFGLSTRCVPRNGVHVSSVESALSWLFDLCLQEKVELKNQNKTINRKQNAHCFIMCISVGAFQYKKIVSQVFAARACEIVSS